MKVYIVMIKDRHADIEPYPFLDRDDAINFAREYLKPFGGEVNERERPPAAWEFYAQYSGEGDSVWIIAKEVA